MTKQTEIDVVVCVHNALEDVKMCLNAVLKSVCKHLTVRLIVIDDGSSVDTRDYLIDVAGSHANITLFRNESATGYTKAANKGLKASAAPFVVLLNSDAILSSRALEKMLNIFKNQADIGMVGPLSNAATWQSIPQVIGDDGQFSVNELAQNTTPDMVDETVETVFKQSPIHPRVPLLNGFCTMFRREVFDTIGYLDEEAFPQGYGEENDYCFRADDAGFGLIVALNTFVFHAKSKSFGNERRKILAKKGGAAFKAKYDKNRIENAVASMKSNPMFARMRNNHLIARLK